jgi:hypothetical protein
VWETFADEKKTKEDIEAEREILNEMVEIVEQRDTLLDMMEEDRQRYGTSRRFSVKPFDPRNPCLRKSSRIRRFSLNLATSDDCMLLYRRDRRGVDFTCVNRVNGDASGFSTLFFVVVLVVSVCLAHLAAKSLLG